MPTQADLFRSFCDVIWNDAGNEHYHTWADAHDTLTTLGAKATGAHDGPDPDDFVEWLFPDGSTACVTRNGHGYKPSDAAEEPPIYTNEVQTTMGLISCLRPHTLRVLRENLTDIALPDCSTAMKPEVLALVGLITELLVDLDGDEVP